MKKNCTVCHPQLRSFAQRWMTTVLLLFSPPVLAASIPPISLTDIAQRGLPILIDTTTADVEMDVPLLAPDGNILHLLGTAHPRPLSNPAFTEVITNLVGVTQPDCTAHIKILVDAATHQSLAQKLKLSCLGHEIHDAFLGGPP